MDKKELLRKLPKIDDLLKEDIVDKYIQTYFRTEVIDSLRETIDDVRQDILEGRVDSISRESISKKFTEMMEEKKKPKLRKVINATGVIIHTNLGRSLLSEDAVKSVTEISMNYNNLEYDIKAGKRGSRYSHVEEIIKKITGAEAAMVVNNNAAAVMLVLNTLCKGKDAIVSRGQLVEIGGSFRVPSVMELSGAKLLEVGTTNRTHLYDYENNIGDNTGVLLKVHTSNFKILGFTEEVTVEELAGLGSKYNLPVYEDIGSGTLVDFLKYGFTYEPTVQESLKKGADIVSFSGDKMLGGPQAGIIVGKKEYIDRMKKNQLTRALRIDKMTLAALEATMKLYLDEKAAVEKIPTLHMILGSKEELLPRASRLADMLRAAAENFQFTVGEDYSMVGGGSMPEVKIPTFVIKVKSGDFSADELERKLRLNDTAIIIRVSNDEVIMDLRTIFDRDFDIIADAFKSIAAKI